jgi:uncharacterized protein YaeQ
MALPSTIYRAALQLSDIDRGVYQTIQTTVARHPSETEERLVARLLAYVLCYAEDLVFTKGICAGDEPDLWVTGPDGRVRQWLEVGLPDAERLIKASRHAEQVTLFACGSALSLWERNQLPRLAAAGTVTVLTVAPSLLHRLVTLLERTITWEITITEATLYLQIGGVSLESPIQVLTAPQP